MITVWRTPRDDFMTHYSARQLHGEDVRSFVLGQDNQQTCMVAKQRAAASGAVSAALWKCCAAACSSPTDAAYAPVRV